MILPKERDPRFVTIRRGGTLTDADHHLLAEWAAACAENVLPLFESAHPDDPRPRRAIEHARAWARGEVTMTTARSAGGHAMAAARDKRGAARHAAFAAGQAAVVAHVAAHELGAAAYAIKAARAAGEAAAGSGQAAAGAGRAASSSSPSRPGTGTRTVGRALRRTGHAVTVDRYDRTPDHVAGSLRAAGLVEAARLVRSPVGPEREDQAVVIGRCGT